MPFNPESEEFYRDPSTVVDSGPGADTVKQGFEARLEIAVNDIYSDINTLKVDGMISIGVPATETARGIGRVATSADLVDGATITNGPAFLSAGDTEIRSLFGDVGDLVASFAASKAGHLLCNGGLYSRTTYADLFALIGIAFGAGDGTTTFKVPDFRGRTLQGANGNLMAVLSAGLPNAKGLLSAWAPGGYGPLQVSATVSSPFYNGGYVGTNSVAGQSVAGYALGIDLSLSSSIYGASTTVQPPAIAVNIFIKY